MEKNFVWMLTAILCLGPMTVLAQDEQEFVVTEGDFNVLKQKGKTGIVELYYDQAKIGNLHSMDISEETVIKHLEKNDSKAFSKWTDIKEEAVEMFMKRWNDEKTDMSNSLKRALPTISS